MFNNFEFKCHNLIKVQISNPYKMNNSIKMKSNSLKKKNFRKQKDWNILLVYYYQLDSTN